MFKPKIIVAEKNRNTRSQIAKVLSEQAYAVETTESAAQLMHSLLQSNFSVVVLGDGLDEDIPMAGLVKLLKRCCPQTTIILVADNVSPIEERMVRQQGIFYQANRPICAMGWNELQLAVSCACQSLTPETISTTAH